MENDVEFACGLMWTHGLEFFFKSSIYNFFGHFRRLEREKMASATITAALNANPYDVALVEQVGSRSCW